MQQMFKKKKITSLQNSLKMIVVVISASTTAMLHAHNCFNAWKVTLTLLQLMIITLPYTLVLAGV